MKAVFALKSQVLVGHKPIPSASHRRLPTATVRHTRVLYSPHLSRVDSSSKRSTRRSESQVLKVETTNLVCEKRSLPLSSAELLVYRKEELTGYEVKEVGAYQMVYYVGNPATKRPTPEFDNEKGDYQARVGEHLGYRYEVISLLGKGSFGIVTKCFDHKRLELVAVKIIKNKKLFHQQGAVEIKVLQTMRELNKEGSVPVVLVKASFVFRKHLCIAFEMLSRSLYEFMKINRFHSLPLSLMRKFSHQILQALDFLRLHHIIHCDVKPENILLCSESKSSVKLIDFGSSCFDSCKVYSYIQSRFYRAPEIILGIGYTLAIDMWSFGCILLEMISGVPAFTGENEREQLALYMQTFGPPPINLVLQSPKKQMFFNANLAPKIYTDSKGRTYYPGAKPLSQVTNLQDPVLLDLVSRCLDWNPSTRLTPEQALVHPWITPIQ